MDPFVKDMHTKSGLLDALANDAIEKSSAWDVAEAAAEFIQGHTHDTKGPMCGSSVHFDRAFIASNMPTLLNSFTRRNIDVSTIKGLNEMWGGVPAPRNGESQHRALPDLGDSINELKFYRDNVFVSDLAVHG